MFSKFNVMLVVLSTVFVGSVSQAYNVEEGEKFCQSFIYSNDKMKCMTEVHTARMYQPKALEVCKGIMYTNDKLECLSKIKNKNYSDTLITTCKDMMYTKKILECLAQFGEVEAEVQPAQIIVTPPNYPPPAYPQNAGNNKHMKKVIRKAIRQMDNGNFAGARRTLEEGLQDAE